MNEAASTAPHAPLFPNSLLYIDGELRPAASGRTYANIGPASGSEIGRAADADASDIETAIAAARRAFDDGVWDAIARSAPLPCVAGVTSSGRSPIAGAPTLPPKPARLSD
jgi:hypothetical protein